MSKIVLATANARYSHCSLALRSLKANLAEYEKQSTLLEFNLTEKPETMLEVILQKNPSLVGLSVFLWNLDLMDQLARLLKSVAPNVLLVVGGPELIDKNDWPALTEVADAVVVGEGELAFLAITREWFSKKRLSKGIWIGPSLDLKELHLPDEAYDQEDIDHRIIYLESSRGCPFGCEFCLSSMEPLVRRMDETKLLESLERLWCRGVRRFKFVDRSLQCGCHRTLLDFFLERQNALGLFLHFELTPQGNLDGLLDRLACFPAGCLQLEVGVQSFDPQVLSLIHRRLDPNQVEAIIRSLLSRTQAHLHTDLVAGLPGENLPSLQKSFDRLYGLGPHEIQVGILKRLRGTSLSRHSEKWHMVYRDRPPYDVLQTKFLDFQTLQHIKRFAHFFDLVANSGNFSSIAKQVLEGESAFWSFWSFTKWVSNQGQPIDHISLNRWASFLFDYLTDIRGMNPEQVANGLVLDFDQAKRVKGLPDRIRKLATIKPQTPNQGAKGSLGVRDRQRRYLHHG